jgi:DnaJ-class molecular chaperone
VAPANNILSDPKKRKAFDSQEEDEDFPLPTGNEKGDFFQIFGKVFERFAR